MLKNSSPQLSEYETLVPNTCNPNKAIEYVNEYISSAKCEHLTVDLSFMNTIDAAYVSTMCSTLHFIKYPEGKINWIVSSKLSEAFSKNMSLGNSEFYTNY